MHVTQSTLFVQLTVVQACPSFYWKLTENNVEYKWMTLRYWTTVRRLMFLRQLFACFFVVCRHNLWNTRLGDWQKTSRSVFRSSASRSSTDLPVRITTMCKSSQCSLPPSNIHFVWRNCPTVIFLERFLIESVELLFSVCHRNRKSLSCEKWTQNIFNTVVM